MNAQLAPAQAEPENRTPIAEYSATERGLADLRARLRDRVYDVTTTKGIDEARKDRAELRGLRVGLDKLRKQLNEDDQARIRVRNEKAKDITQQIVELEDPIDEQIKAEETRKEAARAERERQDAERLRSVNASIDRLRNAPLTVIGRSAEMLLAMVTQLNDYDMAEFDDVHLPTAEQVRTESIAKVTAMHAERVALDAQRAELERQQAELAERQRIADAELAEQQRIAAEARAQADAEAQAERERLAEQDRAAREEQERVDTERRAAEQAERERVAAEQAERQRALDEQAAEQRRVQAEADARAAEAREAAEREAVEQQARKDAAAIERATIVEAVQEAYALLLELGQAQHLTTRKLAAVIARGDA